MPRYAIVVDSGVVNVIEAAADFAAAYATQQGGQAVQSDTAAPGDAYAGGEFTRPAAVAPVPQQVTRRQAKQALLLAGLLSNVQPAIDAIPDATQRALAQLEWDESLNFERHRPILIALAGALGLDSDDLDALFRTAAGL